MNDVEIRLAALGFAERIRTRGQEQKRDAEAILKDAEAYRQWLTGDSGTQVVSFAGQVISPEMQEAIAEAVKATSVGRAR